MTRARIQAPAPLRVVFDGQSHNRWPDATVGDGLGPYPDRLMALVGTSVPWVNVSVNGTGWATLATTAPSRLWPHARRGPGVDMLIMQGGQSDLIEGATPEETYAQAVSYAADARRAGFGLVVGSTMPDITPAAITHDRIQAHNTLLATDPDGAFDAVSRWDQVPALSDCTDSTYFWTDQIHLNVGGAIAAAAATLDTIQPLISHLT